MEKAWNKSCLSCSLLLTQMKETSSDSYRQYNRILQTLMELERKGVLELFAGDCPLEDTDTILGAEQHYTVCQYMRCRSCGAIYSLLIGNQAGLSADGRYQKGKSGHPAVGPVWNLLFTEKRLKEASTWMS